MERKSISYRDSIVHRADECREVINTTTNPLLKILKTKELDYLINLIDLSVMIDKEYDNK